MRHAEANHQGASEANRISLERCIRAIEASRRAEAGVFHTGWRAIDNTLGGLARGAIHEWFGAAGPDGRCLPPMLVLLHLAARAGGVTCWVGRDVWPYGHAARGVREHALLVDPPDTHARWWAADCALRCPGLTVIADGSGLDMASSRRLQLAAASGGSALLAARPEHEIGALSVAATRWLVTPRVGVGVSWTLRLLRCRHAPVLAGLTWDVELSDDRLDVVSPAMGERPRAAAPGA